MAGKYTPLENFLRDIPDHQNEATLTFEQIQRIINDKLPPSAYEYPAWWSNHRGSHVEADAWLNTGWHVDEVNFQEKWVRFIKA